MTLSMGCYAAGYLTGLAAFVWMARRRGMATEGIFLLLAAGLVGGLLCANLAQRVFTGEAGKTILGGIAGGYVSVLCAKRYTGITRPTGDLFAVAICAGEGVGRWGCYFGGCCYGRPTTAAWGVWQHHAWRHPTQLYLSLSCLLILIALVRLETRPDPTSNHVRPENILFCVQGLLYCAARFAVEFWREFPPLLPNTFLLSTLSTAQYACIAGGVFFAARLALLSHTSRRSDARGQSFMPAAPVAGDAGLNAAFDAKP